MKLSDLFNKDNVRVDMEAVGKEDLLERIVNDLNGRNVIRDLDRTLEDVLERERVMSTGIGSGVAIPHAYTDGVDKLVAGFYRTCDGIDFAALDGKEVDLFFIILGPKASRRDHIKVLAKISRLLNHDEFRSNLRSATGTEGVLDVFRRFGDR